jgi:hypothetical protein
MLSPAHCPLNLDIGGVDGEPLGLELDAFPLSRLRGMFADGVERCVDLDKWRADLRAVFLDLVVCELLRLDFDAERRALQEAVQGSRLGDVILDTHIPDSQFRRAAIAGMDHIDPLGLDLFGCAGDVRAMMREARAALTQIGERQ